MTTLLQRELKRLKLDTFYEDHPLPHMCSKSGCKLELKSGHGYVGEAVIYCPEHGILWEDCPDAIARVF